MQYISRETEFEPFSMESRLTVLDLCSVQNVTLDRLCISCLFCNIALSFQDKCAFAVKNLRIVFRVDTAFACCSCCLKTVAYYELCKYYRCSADGTNLDVLSGKCLKELVVRCLTCMKQLEYVEKLEHIARGENFHLVRHYWRGTCRHCRIPE